MGCLNINNGDDFIFNGKHMPFWIDDAERTNFPQAKDGIKVDVAIIGGGIAGISIGTMLKKQGMKVAIIEANKISGNVTAGTTAKITILSGSIYSNVFKSHDKDTALKFRDANKDGFDLIANLIKEFNIDCDYRLAPLYIYSSNEASFSSIENEYKVLKELGISTEIISDLHYPHKSNHALLCENQAEFHPKKYLNALCKFINNEGSFVFEKTRVFDIEELTDKLNQESSGKKPLKKVITENGNIFADFVVVATNSPIYDPDSVCNFMNQVKSYVLGVYTKKDLDKGMYVDINPFHTYRTTSTKKGDILIVGGEHHSIGEVKDTWDCFKSLNNYVEELLDIDSIDYFWSNQDNKSIDSIPIIGETSQNGIYVATGFGSWGMTTGAISANVISDLIMSKMDNGFKKRDYIDIFDPKRFINEKSSKNLEKCSKLDLNSETIELSEDDSKKLANEIFKLYNDEAKIINIGSKSIAIYKDFDGNVYGVSSKCSYSGCPLVWNTAENSWECPEFGSRFKSNGKVIQGPAIFDLNSYL